MSTPRPKAALPEWRKDDILEVIGYGNVVQFTATVLEKPSTVTTLIRTNDTQKTILVSNLLLRKKAS
jgi:hypothetical protein